MVPLFMSLTSPTSISFCTSHRWEFPEMRCHLGQSRPLCLVLCVFLNSKFRIFCWCMATNVVLLLPSEPRPFHSHFYCHSLFLVHNTLLAIVRCTIRLSAASKRTTQHIYMIDSMDPGLRNMCTYDYPIKFFFRFSTWFAEFSQSVLFTKCCKYRIEQLNLNWSRMSMNCWSQYWKRAILAEVQTHLALMKFNR